MIVFIHIWYHILKEEKTKAPPKRRSTTREKEVVLDCRRVHGSLVLANTVTLTASVDRSFTNISFDTAIKMIGRSVDKMIEIPEIPTKESLQDSDDVLLVNFKGNTECPSVLLFSTNTNGQASHLGKPSTEPLQSLKDILLHCRGNRRLMCFHLDIHNFPPFMKRTRRNRTRVTAILPQRKITVHLICE